MEAIASSSKTKPYKSHNFNAQVYLARVGVVRKVVDYRRSQRIYSQGDPTSNVLYIQQGGVKLSVVNPFGKEAVVAILGPGDFLGEGGLAFQSFRNSTATAITHTNLLVIEKDEMVRALHAEHEFSDRFISYMLSRNMRTEEALIDQLFNSSEKRLARALLLLTRYGLQDEPLKWLPKVSQEMLAEMIGATRTRVNFFMTKFKKLGFIGYDGGLHINPSLLSVILHE
jgi:CRP/FNR family cyclic AMP-dependent transcriptional regulator